MYTTDNLAGFGGSTTHPTDAPADSPVLGAPGTLTPAQGSRAAVRLLEIATRDAEELVGEARAEAASILATAQADADQLTAATRADATQVTSSARAEADQLLAETHAAAERMLSEVGERQAALEAEVARLKELEREHRDLMRSYLTEQLAQLDATARD